MSAPAGRLALAPGDVRATALRQLREAIARNARVAIIPRGDLETIRTTLHTIRDLNDRAIHHAPIIDTACRRLLDGIASDAFRVTSVRDVDTLLTYNASIREAA
jgi:hypothetical protein